MSEGPTRLGAILFDRADAPDAAVAAFIDSATRAGWRIAGLTQEQIEGGDEDDVRVRDLVSGATLPIMQNLGPASEGCRVDPAAIAIAARMLDAARAGKPDLLIVNRFGRLESEGGGMIAEIGAAVAAGEAVLICVPLRYGDAWNAFAGGLDTQIAPTTEAIARWWDQISREAVG